MPQSAGKNKVNRAGDTMGTSAILYWTSNGQIISNAGYLILQRGTALLNLNASGVGNTTQAQIGAGSVFFPVQAPTASLPAFVAGGLLWDSTRKRHLSGGNAATYDILAIENPAVVITPATPALLNPVLGNTFILTPNATGNIDAQSVISGQELNLIILTSGVTSFTLTFNANFVSTGTLATGTVSGKYFVIKFVSDGTNYVESSRTVAM